MISVVVPTFNRPQGLKLAVESVFAQSLAASGFELVIVDNTPDASAAEMITSLEAACPPSIRFIALHEPAAGVANARNTAMSAVTSNLVAFLDDDQSAPETWLETLLDNYRAYPAAVTFGPVIIWTFSVGGWITCYPYVSTVLTSKYPFRRAAVHRPTFRKHSHDRNRLYNFARAWH